MLIFPTGYSEGDWEAEGSLEECHRIRRGTESGVGQEGNLGGRQTESSK